MRKQTKMANGFYSCFGNYGIMGGNYIFSWVFTILGIIALVLFIIWIIRKIQSDNNKANNKDARRKR